MSLPDATLRQSAVMTGEIDFADTIDPRTVALMSRMPTLAIRETAGSRACTFPMRLDTGPFGNADLRRALKLAIRRQELVDKVLLGHGRPGNDAPVPDAALPARDFDPDRAAALFRASGHSGPLRLTVSEAAFPGAIDAARLIAASAAEAGIAIEVAAVPAEGYWSEVWNRQSWCAAHWARRATPDLAFATGYLPGAAWNDTGWRGTAFEAAFEDRVRAARAETDEARRAGLHAEAQHLLHEEGGLILPIWANDIAAHGRALASPDTTSPADASEVIGTWWFA